MARLRPEPGTPAKNVVARLTLLHGPRTSCWKNSSKLPVWCPPFPRVMSGLTTSSRRPTLSGPRQSFPPRRASTRKSGPRTLRDHGPHGVSKVQSLPERHRHLQSPWAHDTINIVYKSLQEDRDRADISQITKDQHGSINVTNMGNGEDGRLYDISAIDFDRLL